MLIEVLVEALVEVASLMVAEAELLGWMLRLQF